MADISIVDLTEQPTAVVRETVAMTELTGFFDRVLGTVLATLTEQGIQPAGAPFALYHGMPTETADVEAGFPVAAPVAASVTPSGAVQPGTLPAGRAVQAVHVGPYEALQETYGQVLEFITAQGLTPADEMWECYLTDPGAEPDPAAWQTLVVWPVR